MNTNHIFWRANLVLIFALATLPGCETDALWG